MEVDLINYYSKLSSSEYLQIVFLLRKQNQELIELRAEVAELRNQLWDKTWERKTKENRIK